MTLTIEERVTRLEKSITNMGASGMSGAKGAVSISPNEIIAGNGATKLTQYGLEVYPSATSALTPGAWFWESTLTYASAIRNYLVSTVPRLELWAKQSHLGLQIDTNFDLVAYINTTLYWWLDGGTASAYVPLRLVVGGASTDSIGMIESRPQAATDVGYYLKAAASQSGNLVRLVSSADAGLFTVLASGALGIKTATPSAYADATLEGGALCIKETTTPTADAGYGKIYGKSDNFLYYQDGDGTERALNYYSSVFVQTASVTVTNTSSETTLTGAGVGSLTLPANFFWAGKTIKITAQGFYSTSTPAKTLQIKVKLGSTVILDSTAQNMATNITNLGWGMTTVDLTCRTAGQTGTVMANGFVRFATTHIAATLDDFTPNTTAVVIDTTAAQVLDVTAQWDVTSSSYSVTCTNLVVVTVN